jgi:hypothetical protein
VALISLASLVNPVISAISGLGGVALGGIIASRTHRTERRNARVRDKLDKFYSPFLGMRMQIRAKSEVRVKVSNSGGAAWQSLFTGVDDPERSKTIEAERWPAFEKLIDYSDQQLRDELIPIYRQMLKLFADNMQFAEDSTRRHFVALVEFVELWNRALTNPIPLEVLSSLDHSEKKLDPLYQDLEAQFQRLRQQLED